jgi:hypothetical protein
MSTSTRTLLALCIVAFAAACAPKAEEVVMVEQPLTTDPVASGKF